MSEAVAESGTLAGAAGRRRSLRGKLLLTASLVPGSLLLILLSMNYRRELDHDFGHERTELREQAIAVFEAVGPLRAAGGDRAVQDYVDRMATRMLREGYPPHTIIVRLGGQTFRSVPNGAADGAGRDETTDFAVTGAFAGTAGEDRLAVDVSEPGVGLRTSRQYGALWELAGVAGLAAIAAAVASVILVRSVARPLDRLVETVGRVAAGDLQARAAPADSRELAILSDAVNGMIASLSQNDEDRRRHMAKAREIQRHLLPRDRSVPGLDVAYLFRPADHVAGDYFDVVAMPDGRWLLCLADVAGHGVPAALGAVILRVLLRAAASRGARPGDVLATVNAEFEAEWLPGNFATVFLACWNPARRELEYASAGHEPAWRRDAASGELTELGSTGFPVGVVADAAWETQATVLSPGDALLLTSDGFTEARNADDELFGRRRLLAAFQRCRSRSPSETVTAVDRDLGEFREATPVLDDLTLAVVQCVGEAAGEVLNRSGATDPTTETPPDVRFREDEP